MAITKKENVFKLDTKNTSYLLKITELGYVMHVYYGAKVEDMDLSEIYPYRGRAFSPNMADNPYSDDRYSLDTLPQEYVGSGCSDFRAASVTALDQSGYNSVDLRYTAYEILETKPSLEGLPSTYDEKGETQTLAIHLVDELRKMKVTLFYTVFAEKDLITRSAKVENIGEDSLYLEKAMSVCMDFPASSYDLIQFHGSWANERQEQRSKIAYGLQGFSSKRGTSSHQHNPFCIVCDHETTEKWGAAYAFGLVYSGNHLLQVEKTQTDEVRLTMGINPDDFGWKLEKNQAFDTPEVMMIFSNHGLNDLSQIYHTAVRKHICRGEWRDKQRPILVNNWEATYFDFDEDKIVDLATKAKSLGIEMIVLDDGWFGHRNDDTTSLGDWFTDYHKLPNGLEGLSHKIKEIDMKFGLWIEPEMISEDSELYRKHPDWVLSQEGRSRSKGRTQYVLDFTREEVIDGIWEQLDLVLKNNPIDYIKWDMNRHLTEVGSLMLAKDCKKETYHRQVLGVYQLMNRLVTSYPHILLENCSGGGGRFDLGMLCYSPQIWTSDDTDAIERLSIQYGSSYAYPLSCMGAHVSAVPNHQTGRITPIKTRGDVAMFGVFGYELDLARLTTEEQDIVKKQCAFYKENALLMQQGKFYRIQTPKDSSYAAWSVVSEDEKHIYLLYVTIKGRANGPQKVVKLPYANYNMKYREVESNRSYYGSTLCHAGVLIADVEQDYQSQLLHFVCE
ncbi:MAG: alpha-galactosidase [Eubacteriales bacterium]